MEFRMRRVILAGLVLCKIIFTTALYAQENGIQSLTTDSFKKEIFNYEDPVWNYPGNKPAILVFTTSWCGPCQEMISTLKDILPVYSDSVLFYSIDTDENAELTSFLQVKNVPTTLFIPVNGPPRNAVGAFSKDIIVRAIEEVLLVKTE